MLEVNAKDYKLKKPVKRDYKKSFWKDTYHNRASEEQKEMLNNIVGYNNDLWKHISEQGFDWETLKVETIKSNFENEKPGYIGKFSGDLIVNYKGTVVVANVIYTNTWSERIDTVGFW